MPKEEREKFEINLLAYFKYFFAKCQNILWVSYDYIEVGLDLAFYSLDRESSKQTSEEAKEVLESFEMQIFNKEDFEFLHGLLNKKYCSHTNWRVRHQAIYLSGVLSTKLSMDVDYQKITPNVYVYIYDEELRIRWMAVVLFENIFNILPNQIREQAI